MITVVVVANPLRPTERQVEQVAAPMVLSDWLMQRWPDGARGTLSVVVDGTPVPLDQCEGLVLNDGAHLLLIVIPALPAGVTLAQIIVSTLISMAISMIVSAIFRPRKPAALVDQPASSPVYSISGSQNAARLGEPIPVIYGEVIQVPDFGSQPYTEFDSNHDQYLNEILVIGQGLYEIKEMLVGESTVGGILPSMGLQWWPAPPSVHGKTLGNIEAAYGVMENVVTSPEVGDQELTAGEPVWVAALIYWRAVSASTGVGLTFPPPAGYTVQTIDWLQAHGAETVGTAYTYSVPAIIEVGGEAGGSFEGLTWYIVVATAYAPPPYTDGSLTADGHYVTPDPGDTAIGWFDCCKPGQVGDRIMLDFVFPGGLYTIDSGDGSFDSRTVEVLVEVEPIGLDGEPLLPAGAGIIGWTESFTDASNTTRRYTRSTDLDPARYRCRCSRITANAANSSITDKVVWFGLKLRVPATTTGIVYGDTTLVVVRMKATNAIASAATSRLRFRVKRRLAVLGDGPVPLEGTSNPADAFVDILAADYGAKRPPPLAREIDMPTVTALRAAWSAHNGFNGVFAQKSTIFEALSTVLQVVAAGPMPLGALMSVEVDSVKDMRLAMFTEANVRELTIGYEFDKVGTPPGVRVEYRDPISFSAAFVTRPIGEIEVDSVSLFGCTDEDTAEQYAQLLLNRKRLQRKTISFTTEQEGLLLLPGDRIAVQHQMPRWGQVAIVDEVVLEDTTIPATGEPHTLLLHADGADASTSFPDKSLNAATITPAGNAQVDTAQAVFGGASLLLDGTGDYLDTPVHARYDIGAISAGSNHTWRFRARFPSVVAAQALMAHAIPGSTGTGKGGYVIYLNAGKLGIQIGSNASSAVVAHETAAVLNPPTGGDSFFSNVKLLLHGESGLADSSSVGNTFGSVSHVGASAVRSRYGSGSIIATNEDATAKIAASAAFQETAAWTMEFSFYADSALMFASGLARQMLARDNTRYWTVARNAGGITISCNAWGANFAITGLSLNAWHDIAVCREASGVWHAYADGVRFQTLTDASGYTANTTNRALNLVNVDTGGFLLAAYGIYLDEIRYTANVARYTGASYTLAGAAFPDSAGTPSVNWYALAFVIAAGVPHIYVDGIEQAGTITSSGDLSFANVGLLLHCDGGAGSTAIVDSGSLNKTVAVNGGAVQSTTQKKFGVSSCALNGAGAFLSMNDDDAVMRFDALDASVECWAYFTANPGSYAGDPGIMLWSQGVVGARACELFIGGAALSNCTVKASLWVGTTNNAATATAQNLALNTWHFFQWVRNGSTLSLGINGVQVATVSVGAASMNNSAANLLIGAFNDATYHYYLPGYIDECRVTKGVARAIALPTQPFPAATVSGGSFIGVDTTRTDYALRIGAPCADATTPAFAAVAAWLDEISVMIGTARYTANYTPEAAAFADPTPESIGTDIPTLILDRGLDWDGTPEPHAVMLSSERNEVSAALACHRGDADHECVLDDDAPFDLFGKGDHQEPTRVAFGTVDNIVRDWIVTAATPQQGMAVQVEGLVYDPAVYDGAMPHQGGEALPLPLPPGGWMIAGTPDAFAPDWTIGGTPAAPSTDRVLAGTPDDPMTWLEPEGPP